MTYSKRKVLVTGADGFIGSHLTEALVRQGARTRAFCFYNSSGSRGWLDELTPSVAKEIDFQLGDIRDSRFVERACKGIDIVFHLAALIAIPYSYLAAESFLDTNARGTLNILEGVRRANCGRMVQTSTSEVYGTPATLPIRETHPLQGQSPYSASKIAADMMCEAYYRSFKVPVVTLRPFNTYGPRQSARAIVPTILAQLLSGAKVIELGNLKPKRDLTFVGDTVRGFLAAGWCPDLEGQVIQLGTGRTESVADIFTASCSALSVEAEVIRKKERMRPDKSEVMILQSDPALAAELLDWRAEVTLEEGLSLTANWIQSRLGSFREGEYVL